MNTFCHMKDSLCLTFSQNLFTKVAFSPLFENEISSEQKSVFTLSRWLVLPTTSTPPTKMLHFLVVFWAELSVTPVALFHVRHGQLGPLFTAAGSYLKPLVNLHGFGNLTLDRKTQPYNEGQNLATGARMHVRNVFSGLYRMQALISPKMELPGP